MAVQADVVEPRRLGRTPGERVDKAGQSQLRSDRYTHTGRQLTLRHWHHPQQRSTQMDHLDYHCGGDLTGWLLALWFPSSAAFFVR